MLTMSLVVSAMCWAPGAVVELEVLVDLGAPPALGRLVDRELDPPVAARDDLRHQGRVLGRDRLVGEVDHLGHPEHALVEGHPLAHRAELDVADDVVDALDERRSGGQRERGRQRARRPTNPGRNGPVVPGPIDKAMDGLAVGGDIGGHDAAAGVRSLARLRHAKRPAGDSLAVGVLNVGHTQRDHLDAVAVAGVVTGHVGVGAQRAGQDQAHVALRRARARRRRGDRSRARGRRPRVKPNACVKK